MGECLRRACPCLETLWQRSSGEKEPSAGGGGGEGGGGGGGEETAPQETGSDSSSLYTAVWPFEARHEDELSFLGGDLFRVTSRSGDWWTARKMDPNGRVLESGIVPNNYLVRAESLKLQPWFFGKMNRFEAQGHLQGAGNEDGSFLIRQSEKDNVGYVLSVRSSSRVKHFRIHQAADMFSVEPTQSFSSLVELVTHYGSNSLVNTGQLGTLCRRKKPDTPDLNHFTVDEWELPQEQFTLEEELGTGYFADVYRGRWKNHINVAIKIIKSDSELNHREFQREVQILKSLRHRHLISLFAVCTASSPYYIITELMEKGSLLTFLRGPEGALQDAAALIDMGAQVADGMSYLEEQNSIHRDLAARNVLVGGDYICKVADFGLARVIKEPFYISEDKKIPYKWCAPEAISHGKFSNKSDVWSFGVLLYEIITYGGVPYPAFSNQEVFQQVTKGYRMPAPAKCPDLLYGIMMQCWSHEPNERPHFKSLKLQLDGSSYEMG
ncbi:protein-tyrosine kinase 6b [Hippoglossus hippoglossus]|uniref:protein-tyrosine kinase 6b n=1 Tax=Hippoglossus hippoglossus TaxID=8267 RepID=UPI00148D3ED0|nr:protein-tyrosine kinase 6b [Hippoglossus hippoglossus]XP_034445707.1 protein-tyrosine kinase 6b [Hippoglossus hippoglossus]